MTLSTLPAGWTPTMLDAFNALVEACEAYMIYDYTLRQLGVTDPVLLQRRTDLGTLIAGTLGPAFRNAT